MDSLLLIAFGYALAVLFPVPGLSRFILDNWSKIPTLISSIKTVLSAFSKK